MENIAIVGGGSWGCALARILGDNGHNVIIYDRDENSVDEINNYHTNSSKLKDGVLPESVVATTNIKEAIDKSEIVVLVVPTAVIRSVLKNINDVLDKKIIFVNASKGIEPDTYKRVSEIVYEEINDDYIEGFVALTGPSHAEEVVEKKLTCVASASNNHELAVKIQNVFSNKTYFRVYAVTDLIGAELGGSLKNVYAMVSGMAAGLGFGVNAQAALIARSLAEMNRLAEALGAKHDTLFGLTGVGDLIVTCTSPLSRNYQAGYMIGNGDNLEEALSKISMVVEGARTCISAYQVSKELNIYTPIIDALYNVIYLKKNPREAALNFMKAELKDED